MTQEPSSTGDKGQLDNKATESLTPARFSLKPLILAIIILCVAIAVTGKIIREVQKTKQGIRCQYALWQVEDMISTQILRASSPPENWDDLKEAFLFTNESYATSSFEELKASVFIDFQLMQTTFQSDSCCASEGHKIYHFVRCQPLPKEDVLLSAEITANNRIHNLLCHLQQEDSLAVSDEPPVSKN